MSLTARRLPSPRMSTADEITLGQLNVIELSREDARWQTPHEIIERDGVVLFAGASEFPAFCNGVRRVDDAVPGTRVVEIAQEYFTARGRGFSLFSRVLPVDDDLHDAAVASGIAEFGDSPQMICRVRVPDRDLPVGVTIEPVRTRDQVEHFGRIGGESYAVYGAPAESTASHFNGPNALAGPNVHAVLASLDGVPVGAACILMSHGIAGVYWVAVLEEARGRGIAFAVTQHVTNLGFDLGAANVQLQASTMGEPVYLRMGYEELHRTRLHIGMPSA